MPSIQPAALRSAGWRTQGKQGGQGRQARLWYWHRLKTCATKTRRQAARACPTESGGGRTQGPALREGGGGNEMLATPRVRQLADPLLSTSRFAQHDKKSGGPGQARPTIAAQAKACGYSLRDGVSRGGGRCVCGGCVCRGSGGRLGTALSRRRGGGGPWW